MDEAQAAEGGGGFRSLAFLLLAEVVIYGRKGKGICMEKATCGALALASFFHFFFSLFSILHISENGLFFSVPRRGEFVALLDHDGPAE